MRFSGVIIIYQCGELTMRWTKLWSIVVTRTNDAMDQTLVHLRTDGPERRAIFAGDWIESEFSSPSLYKDQYQLCT